MNILTDKIKTVYFKYLVAAFGSTLISSIYCIVDMAMVGQYHDPEGSAAMGVFALLWNIIYSFGLLAGIGGSVLFSNIRGKSEGNERKASDVINDSMLKYYKEYLCVGGMPDTVNTFLQTNDLNQVYDIQYNILEQYKDDFGKHLDENENQKINQKELVRIMEVYNSIPNQLAKENKKFQYSVINKNAKGREYRNAITWLEEFGLIKNFL